MPGQEKIENRFALWGISQASQYIIRNEIVHNYRFTLSFDNSDVGYIVFSRNQVQLSLAGSGIHAQNQTRSTISSNSSVVTLMSPQDEDITLSMALRNGKDLTKFKIFANIFNGLAITAKFPPNQRLQDIISFRPSTYLETAPSFFAKTSPSVFKYRHAAIALLTAGFYVLAEDVFEQMLIRIMIDVGTMGEIYIVEPGP